MSTSQNSNENVHALNQHNEEIHISLVSISERGRGRLNQYFCRGCKRQLQAVIQNIEGRESFFRHDFVANRDFPKCDYSDETYRHKLTKEILQRLKRIKIPAIYKYPPSKEWNKVFLIKESEMIYAHSVLIEHQIYEDEQGNIKFNGNTNDHKNFLIRPDVIFLNHLDEPILLIEIVATHKPDVEKLTKLRRLGVNAIQVTVSRDSSEEIERSFHVTERTKWLYSYEETKYDYFQFSSSHTNRILEFGDIQGKFFEENFQCRITQIRNLIRYIERTLESEYYQGIESRVGGEIRRVERNIERAKDKLGGLQTRYGSDGINEYFERRKKIESRRRNLEGRYSEKRFKLESEEGEIEDSIRTIEFEIERHKSGGENIIRTIKETEKSIEILEYEIGGLEVGEGKYVTEYESNASRVLDKISKLPINFDRDRAELDKKFRAEEERIRIQIRTIENEERDLSGNDQEIQKQIDDEFSTTRKKFDERINRRSLEGSEWFESEYNKLFALRTTILEHIKFGKRNQRLQDYIQYKIKKK